VRKEVIGGFDNGSPLGRVGGEQETDAQVMKQLS